MGCLIAYLEERIKYQQGADSIVWSHPGEEKQLVLGVMEEGESGSMTPAAGVTSGIGNAQGKAVAVFGMQDKSLRRNFSHVGRKISLSLIDGGWKGLARFKQSLDMRTHIEMSKSKMIHRSKM